MEQVWPDSVVEENNLTVSMSALRKALGERRQGSRYIVTVPRRGYRFIADVRVVIGSVVSTPPVEAEGETDGVRVELLLGAVRVARLEFVVKPRRTSRASGLS